MFALLGLSKLAKGETASSSTPAASDSTPVPAVPTTPVVIQPKLFTPGPLLTSKTVKEAMCYDYGSRDPRFIAVVKEIRNDVLRILEVEKGEYECVLLQGSGSYGVEAALGTAIPRANAKLLVIANGAYGLRQVKMAEIYNIPTVVLEFPDSQVVLVNEVEAKLAEHPDITHVSVIHSETTSGLINPIAEIAAVAKKANPNITVLVDAMSSFGAYRINPKEMQIDYVIASSNKNIQGIPGFAFVVARKEALLATQGNARSLVLDLYDQWRGLEGNGQFRFTPPTHVLKGTKVALEEYFAQGGLPARFERYNTNQKLLQERVTSMGFKMYLDPAVQGCIITTFLQPTHPNFVFQEMYDYLAERNLVIYPGKLTKAESFRIGSIGEITPEDINTVCDTILEFLSIKSISIPVSYI